MRGMVMMENRVVMNVASVMSEGFLPYFIQNIVPKDATGMAITTVLKNLIGKLKKQNWTFTFIGTDDLDVETIAMDMGIDNHLQFAEDEAGTQAMFARENRARERYNKCRAMDCKMEVGSYFEEK